MKTRFIGAMAAGLALGQVAVPAYAQPAAAATQFRAVEAQTFSAEDLQRYGLDADQAATAVALQEEGYRVLALSPEEAEAYRAGAITQTELILIGIGVLIILVVAD